MRRLAVLVLTLLAWGPAAFAQPAEPPVDVAHPLVRETIDYDLYTGRFEAIDRVEIVARVSGYLDEIHFTDGDRVDAGDLLFTIDQRTFEAAVARARAQVASAEATRDLAEIERARAVQLAERNVGTAQEVDRTSAALAEAEAGVQVAEAELVQAELNLDFTEVRAPFAGRMSDARVDVGNYISGGTAGATVLATIVATDPIHFVFTASEADFLRYSRLTGTGERRVEAALSLDVEVRLMDEDSFDHHGTMDFVDNELDQGSGTIEGRAVLANEDGFLVPGMFGRLRLPGSGAYDAVLVPETAVLSDQARKIVMVVDEAGVVSPRPVETGPRKGAFLVIRSGLSPEDRVIVAGVQRARAGQTVTPQEVTLEFGEE